MRCIRIEKPLRLWARHIDHTVKMAGNKTVIDNITYCYDDLDTTPSVLREAILKKEKKGGGGEVSIAYRGKECILSNFYPDFLRIEGKQCYF